jgi:hypothetical protein
VIEKTDSCKEIFTIKFKYKAPESSYKYLKWPTQVALSGRRENEGEALHLFKTH